VYAFDPTAVRARLLGDEIGLQFDLERAREQAQAAEQNLHFWSGAMLNELSLAYFVGLADHPKVAELRTMILESLRPERWADVRARVDSNDRHYSIARAWSGLALTLWLASGARRPDLFAAAHAAYARYFEATSGKQSKWPVDSVGNLVTLACAAGDHAAVRARFARAQLAGHAGRTVDKVRTPLDLGQAIAAGTASPAELAAAADRMLRHKLAAELEGGSYGDGAQMLYLASLTRPPGPLDVPRLLADATQYIRYLAPKPAAKPKPPATKRAKPLPPLPPPPAHPLPPIGISAAVYDPFPPPPRWHDLGDGRWAVRIMYGGCQSIPLDRRLPDIVELHVHDPGYARAPGLQRMTRATVDGETLSLLAGRGEPCPLEVMFPLCSPNSVDGERYQMSPKLTRGHWRQALAVGALVNLRAVTFDACEDDRQRVARGAAPYELAPAWFWQSPLARQLEALDIQADVHSLAVWPTRFAELPRLRRVYLRMWVKHTTDAYSRAVRFVIDRVDDRLAWTLQYRAHPLAIPDEVLAALFAGLAPDQVQLDVEAVRLRVEHEADLAAHLGQFARVREVRGEAPLREL